MQFLRQEACSLREELKIARMVLSLFKRLEILQDYLLVLQF